MAEEPEGRRRLDRGGATLGQAFEHGRIQTAEHPLRQHFRPEATVEVEYLDEGTEDCPTGREVLCPVQVRISSHLDVWTPLIPEVDVLAQATMHIE